MLGSSNSPSSWASLRLEVDVTIQLPTTLQLVCISILKIMTITAKAKDCIGHVYGSSSTFDIVEISVLFPSVSFVPSRFDGVVIRLTSTNVVLLLQLLVKLKHPRVGHCLRWAVHPLSDV